MRYGSRLFHELAERYLVSGLFRYARGDHVGGRSDDGPVAAETCSEGQGPPEHADSAPGMVLVRNNVIGSMVAVYGMLSTIADVNPDTHRMMSTATQSFPWHTSSIQSAITCRMPGLFSRRPPR